MSGKWTASDLPDQSGRVTVVTGANTGIGLPTAAELARHGARVVMACRSPEKARAAADGIIAEGVAGNVDVLPLDLADLASVRSFSDAFRSRYDRLDLLINNAGVMWPPLSRTADGFELQFGTNHLGHFALTARLLERLRETGGARVITVSSVSHRFGAIDFDDLQWQSRPYRPNRAYGQSKLANLLFTYELQRRVDRAGVRMLAAAAHPGFTGTDLQRHAGFVRLVSPWFGMEPWQGRSRRSSPPPPPTSSRAATTAPTAWGRPAATRAGSARRRRPGTRRWRSGFGPCRRSSWSCG